MQIAKSVGEGWHEQTVWDRFQPHDDDVSQQNHSTRYYEDMTDDEWFQGMRNMKGDCEIPLPNQFEHFWL